MIIATYAQRDVARGITTVIHVKYMEDMEMVERFMQQEIECTRPGSTIEKLNGNSNINIAR